MANLTHVGRGTIFYGIATILLFLFWLPIGSIQSFPSVIVPVYLFFILTYIDAAESHLRAIDAGADANRGLKGFVAAAVDEARRD